jgi:hypothetical protein
VPELLPAIHRAADRREPRFDSSAMLAQPLPLLELPSQAKPEGNVTRGGESKVVHVLTDVGGLEAELFENKAEVKLLTSQVAMHLTAGQRNALFAAIDRLLNIENWEDESSKIDQQSYRSFLRCIIYAHPRKAPNMGVGPDGTVLAAWHSEENSVQVEFSPGDQCVALIRSHSVRGPERFAWRGHVARFRDIIENNGATDCIDR